MVCQRAIWILLLLLVAGAASGIDAASERRGLLIAFGSCSKQWESQPLWSRIEALHPEVWLWLGDNIYGDRPRSLGRYCYYCLKTKSEQKKKKKSGFDFCFLQGVGVAWN